MNIAVIAANGRSGQAFVAAALAAGHSVNAGVHGKSFFSSHPNLHVMDCDATEPNELARLIHGQDAVVSLIGHVKASAPDVQTVAMEAIVQAMQEKGLRRLISLTGTGVRFEGDKITMIDRILNVSIRIIDPARIKDGIQHAEIMKKSNLEWTLIRVLKLQNTSPKPFRLLAHGPTKLYVSRYDVASAVLQVLTEHSFICQAPIIGR